MSRPRITKSKTKTSWVDTLPNEVHVRRTNGGIVFGWSRPGIGFGLITMTVKRGQLYLDDECMGPDFCLDVIRQAITNLVDGPPPNRTT